MNRLETLRKALRRSPENVALRKQVADMLLRRGQYEDAESEYVVALHCRPNDDALLEGLAWCYYHLDKLSATLVIAEKLLEDEPVRPTVDMLYAKALAAKGRINDAAIYFARAVAQDPLLEDETLQRRLEIGGIFHPKAHGGARFGFEARFTSGSSTEDPASTHVSGSDLASHEADAAPKHQSDHSDPDSLTRERQDHSPDPNPVSRRMTSEPNFSSIAGLEPLKQALRQQLILPMQVKMQRDFTGKKSGLGALLYGSPGCGKRTLARAIAGEMQSRFHSIDLHNLAGMWLGQSERQLQAVFRQARSMAPSVLCLEGLEALSNSCSEGCPCIARGLIARLLTELDGGVTANDGVLVLGITSSPWYLDQAFRRPGRLDRVWFVPPPDETAREQLWRIHLKDRPVADIEFSLLAKKTDDYSGADIRRAIDLAVQEVLGAAMQSDTLAPITTDVLLRTIRQVQPGVARWFASAKEHLLGPGNAQWYDDMLHYLKSQ